MTHLFCSYEMRARGGTFGSHGYSYFGAGMRCEWQPVDDPAFVVETIAGDDCTIGIRCGDEEILRIKNKAARHFGAVSPEMREQFEAYMAEKRRRAGEVVRILAEYERGRLEDLPLAIEFP